MNKAIASASAREPMATKLIGMSRSVRRVEPAPAPLRRLFTLSRNEDQIVGSVRASDMIPAIATAPAPIRRM